MTGLRCRETGCSLEVVAVKRASSRHRTSTEPFFFHITVAHSTWRRWGGLGSARWRGSINGCSWRVGLVIRVDPRTCWWWMCLKHIHQSCTVSACGHERLGVKCCFTAVFDDQCRTFCWCCSETSISSVSVLHAVIFLCACELCCLSLPHPCPLHPPPPTYCRNVDLIWMGFNICKF